jgi:hypothetical protein
VGLIREYKPHVLLPVLSNTTQDPSSFISPDALRMLPRHHRTALSLRRINEAAEAKLETLMEMYQREDAAALQRVRLSSHTSMSSWLPPVRSFTFFSSRKISDRVRFTWLARVTRVATATAAVCVCLSVCPICVPALR